MTDHAPSKPAYPKPAQEDIAKMATLADAAARQIPPLFPLASSVAVNPFLGQTGESLASTAARLERVGGVSVIMPRSWFRERITSGEIDRTDLADALEASPHADKPQDVAALMEAVAQEREPMRALPSVAELVAEADGVDWPGLIDDRIGAWAAARFDRGQALWAAPRAKGSWSAYRAHAVNDLTPEIMGLTGFATFMAETHQRPSEAAARAVKRLGLSEASCPSYFHQLLHALGGWAQYARYLLWQAELAGGDDATITDLLTIRLAWEEALFDRFEDRIADRWAEVCAAHAAPVAPDQGHIVDEILQEAAERSAQRQLASTLASPGTAAEAVSGAEVPALQAAFCIDVRSEVFRRALESVDPPIRTLGFAGFFGVFAQHRGFASDEVERRLPVLLNPTVQSTATSPAAQAEDRSQRYRARAVRAWGRFRQAAVSSFAFVEATGPVYAAKLVRDALRLGGGKPVEDPMPRFDPALDLPARTGAAETVLRAMSLTEGFARLVLLAGHGANVVNNPQESGLHCGACGGYSGEVNARLLASLLNDIDVRAGLVERGIVIPESTVFVAALHDTTTDHVTLYDGDVQAAAHREDLARARTWLAAAGKVARSERALRLPHAKNGGALIERSRDWAEVRPEWGLAGCSAFIAAPRSRTAGRGLSGRAFLHDYDWRKDGANGFPVLELIMTAPVVVASWISLQYYGSAVAPDAFGAGNKLLHNVVGGIGVFEGNGGMMRGGLAWQSVHDGERLMHDPLRLSVCIEAPMDAMTEILARHEGVRSLFDNKWLHLFAIGEDGGLSHRYSGDLTWESVEPAQTGEAAEAA